MTGALGRLAGPRRGAGGRVLDVIAAGERASGAHRKCSGRGPGVPGASFSAAC
jgi:hypothetical protein